jgi:hypothetical protein
MPSTVSATEKLKQCTTTASSTLIVVFTLTTFWGSTLLFLLEPLFAKIILPIFGGSPAVWNTAMVFFQATLFLAYIYSHYVARWTPRWSVLVHSLVIVIPLLVLPISIHGASNINTLVSHATVAVLMIAVSSIGLPFFLVATSAPLLQKWFSQKMHRNAADPYFLYAASNLGSLIGLALYPCVLEPRLQIGQQSTVWSIGYAPFFCLDCDLWRSRISMAQPEPIPKH